LSHRNFMYIITGVSLLVVISFVVAPFLPSGVDWSTVFRPAAREMLYLRSPFSVEGFFNPPWTAMVLIPFAVFPEQVGRVLLIFVGLIAYAYIAYKLGGSKWAITAIVLSPPVMYNMLNGNIDWLV
jgi:hypothetical protein